MRTCVHACMHTYAPTSIHIQRDVGINNTACMCEESSARPTCLWHMHVLRWFIYCDLSETLREQSPGTRHTSAMRCLFLCAIRHEAHHPRAGPHDPPRIVHNPEQFVVDQVCHRDQDAPCGLLPKLRFSGFDFEDDVKKARRKSCRAGARAVSLSDGPIAAEFCLFCRRIGVAR